jgi:hypothetical protein
MKAQSFPVTQDSYVMPASATNYGTAITLNVGGPTNAEALVQFDLTSLQGMGSISKATLVLFVNRLTAVGSINIADAASTWSETSVTGLNAPSAGALTAGPVPVSTVSSFISVDITSIVNGWLSGTANNGLLITPAGGVNVSFDSKESTTTSHPATLSIVSGIQGYAYIYNLTPEDIAIEADVPFDSNGPLSGFIHSPGGATITIVNAGVYSVTFSVSGTEPNQFALTQNGAPLASAIYGSGAGTQQNTGQAIIVAAAGDILTLRNHTSAVAVALQAFAGGSQNNVNASVLILKIQ